MNVWGGVKMLFGFGASANSTGTDNVMKVVEGVGGWIDNLKYTDQEQVADNLKRLGLYHGYLEQTMGENSERSRSRRDIALLVIRWELIMLTASALLFKIDADWSKYLYKIATTEVIVYLVLGIGAFFFGAHLIRTHQSKK